METEQQPPEQQQQQQQEEGQLEQQQQEYLHSRGEGALQQQQQQWQVQESLPDWQDRHSMHAGGSEVPAAGAAEGSKEAGSSHRDAVNADEENTGPDGFAACEDSDSRECAGSEATASHSNSRQTAGAAARVIPDAGEDEAHEAIASTAGGGCGDGGRVVWGSRNEAWRISGIEAQKNEEHKAAAAAGSSMAEIHGEEEQQGLVSLPPGASAHNAVSTAPSAEGYTIGHSLVGSEGRDGAAHANAGSAGIAGAYTQEGSQPHAPERDAAESTGACGPPVGQGSSSSRGTQQACSPALVVGGEGDPSPSRTRPYHIGAGEALQQHLQRQQHQHQHQQQSRPAPTFLPLPPSQALLCFCS
mmetsp:Transcript_11816/g.32222  ORF Transcript_11816/g.32222 Transcript_11816/m.32222 type:complete len:358 (-) Transcript_11816:1048-2121(-)